ncbi:MAG: hypothetical protein EXQ84_02085 [Rhodospirillaceae bacterium]|nr:hypothetical protein [Rhodospirillaceae bacterium]
MSKRELLKAAIGTGIGLSLGGKAVLAADAPAGRAPRGLSSNVKRRQVKTTALFKSPPGFPNAADLDPEGRGIWIGEQKMSAQNASIYKVPEPKDLSECAWLMDWNGKLLKTVKTEARNTSGMAVGGGFVWMIANAAPNGVFQTDMDSRTVSHRQIPLGGGGCHGGKYRDGKLWIASTRLRGLMRVDATTWQPEHIMPVNTWDRTHDMAFDDAGGVWVITGTRYSDDYKDERPGMAKYDLETGRLLEYAEFGPNDSDPHGLVFYNGAFYSCDAGIHPGWPTNVSKTAGYVFRIDLT